MLNPDMLQIIKKYKQAKGSQYGIQKIGLFGSMARGTAHSQSDIDIVVVLSRQDLFNLIGIKQDLETEFQTSVDIISYRPQMNPALKSRIDREAIYV